ncbi:unnamed protein product [Schistocephalus solidus]|uniref:Reverse transcriptase domain-containing protein n=1 Tax=Schistocephalus solidus TaxID=70667 RepID=A0A183T7V4_SCHSO|nr:unnamed protein product [Schistocephalus solidus]
MSLTNEVKQGCVKAPTLFSLMFSAKVMYAYHDEHPGISIAYRNDNHLLNSPRMQAATRVSMTAFHDLLMPEDCALNTVTEEDMQRCMNLFAAGFDNFGLAINTANSVAMHHSPCSPNQCQQRSTQKCRNLCLSEKHTVTQHENRRRGCSTDFQSQSGLRQLQASV